MNDTDCRAEQDLKEIKKTLSIIRTSLIGNEFHPDGLITQVKTTKLRVDALEQAQARIKWVAMGFFMAGGGSGIALLKVFGT